MLGPRPAKNVAEFTWEGTEWRFSLGCDCSYDEFGTISTEQNEIMLRRGQLLLEMEREAVSTCMKDESVTDQIIGVCGVCCM
jgi:hypothetical protein